MKLFVGKPFLLMFVCLFAFVVMHALGIGLPGLFIMWKIFDDIAKMAGYPERNEFCTIMVSSAVTMFVFVSLSFPWNPGSLMQIGLFNKGMPDMEVSYAMWIVVWTLFATIYPIIWTLFVKYVIRPDFSAIAEIKDFSSNDRKEEKLTFDQKFALSMLALFMVMMFVPSFLPKTIPLVAFLNSFGLCGALGLVLCIMCAYMKKDGKPFLSLQVAAKGIMWDVMWLLMATEPLANALNDAECGIMSSLLGAITPVLTQLPLVVFLAASCLILGAVTQVVHNLVLMVVFFPILCPMYAQMGGDSLAMFICLSIALNAAFATPAASWSSAMMFGVSSIQPKKMYFYGATHFLLSTLLGILVVPFLVGLF